MEILKKEIVPLISNSTILELQFVLPQLLRDQKDINIITQYDAKKIHMNYSYGSNLINYKYCRRVWNNFDTSNMIIHNCKIDILPFKINLIILEWYDLYLNSIVEKNTNYKRDVTGHIVAHWFDAIRGDLLYRAVFNNVSITDITETGIVFTVDYYTEVEVDI